MAPHGYWCKATQTDADCNSGDVCNPATLRCVAATGQLGRRILASRGSGRQPSVIPQPTPQPMPQPPRQQGGRTVTLLIGPTGAGKSTYAAALSKETGAVIVSSDAFKSSRPKINAATRAALVGGNDVIVDATHPTAERRAQVAAIARSLGAVVKCVKFDVEKSNAARRSSLSAPAKYIVASKFFKNYNNLGSECDVVTVRTNANFGTLSAAPAASDPISIYSSEPSSSGPISIYSQSPAPSSSASASVMKAPMLALKYDPSKHSGVYYVSEKLDGIRAMFVGGKLYTRNGNMVAAPQWFLDAIPTPGTYDGELFAGRGKFTKAMSIVMRSRPVDEEWKDIQYRIFDDFASTTKFSNTLARLSRVLPTCSSPGGRHMPVCMEPQHRVDSDRAVQSMLQNAHALGAEGLMLRANTTYKSGSRTKNVLKVKKVHDAEATVIGYDLDASNKLRSLLVKWDNGVTFKVGTGFSLQEREQWKTLFKIGARVTVQYAELTAAGKARFPVFKAVRRNI